MRLLTHGTHCARMKHWVEYQTLSHERESRAYAPVVYLAFKFTTMTWCDNYSGDKLSHKK